MLHEVTSEAMRLPLPLLLVFGCKAILGSLGDNKASLSATAPVLDDEEKYASYMPDHLRCDACRAVAYQMGQHLEKAEAKSPDSSDLQELSESIYTDVLDRTCSQKWQSYGVQEVNQMKRLVGPGLSKGTEAPISVMITGGPWPNRLSRTCFQYLGEFEEDQIYEAYRQGHETLEALLCGGPRGSCSPESPREEL
ncbi:marginal zone B- and B1-cell-specific protein [Mesocricetus auratus]|uniref:Marginal zone B- and B1-cell-specific protein n=1 Tax=Mesocricetus auratus TaxID=10036 RepID=A0A1U7QDI7_MESAU|nr:marginal zone B- and B1-cell-specific protein [Mesocricetus auratus]